MAGRINGLKMQDELNLYLVSEGIKPASIIDLDPTFFQYVDGYDIEVRGGNNLIFSKEDMRVRTQDIFEFKNILVESDVEHKFESFWNFPKVNVYGDQISVNSCNFYIGMDKFCLDSLVNAKTHSEKGLALGYPLDDVAAFQDQINKPIMAARFYRELQYAGEVGIERPTWLAYLSHMPNRFNLLEDDVSGKFRNLGMMYRQFVCENNPLLAIRVEKNFFKELKELDVGSVTY
mgnify:FL=1